MIGGVPAMRRGAFVLRRWWRETRLARRAVVHESPHFILGMQKSGTSAIAGLLALRTGVPTTVDLEREWRASTIDRAASGPAAFRRFVRRNAADFSRPVIKEPSLTFVTERLREYWPGMRPVLVVRDPVATIRSILDRLDVRGDLPTLGPSERRRVPDGWRTVLDNGWLGIDAPHYVDQLAERWNLAAGLAVDPGPDWLVIRYEDFVADKLAAIDRVVEHFDLRHHREIDAFLDRPFQPRGRRRPPEEVFGANLQRILDRTSPLARRLGYHP